MIDAAREAFGENQSAEWLANNMVSWFSQRITMETSDWAAAFERTERRPYAYKPADGRLFPDQIPAGVKFHEGAAVEVLVNVYERDPRARRKCIEHFGASCSVCGFDFGAIFGEIGEGFIHVHHLRKLSDIGIEYEFNPIQDLRPVCPNCHAMLHRRDPPYTIDELRELLRPRAGWALAFREMARRGDDVMLD